MEAAKQAVKSFIKNDRHSDTEVREIVKPAITKERIIEENREVVVTAIDRELHQDHYQTRIQPIVDKQILPEEHHHRAVPVAVKEHKHHKEADIARALEHERTLFRSEREVLPTKHISAGTETVVGEHHHHHVYETIQPVIEREVIKPVVTHTTVPVKEVIEKEPTFHPPTVQPVMTMEQFLKAGGSLEGRTERREIFTGEPQVVENGGADERFDTRRSGHFGRSRSRSSSRSSMSSRHREKPSLAGAGLTATERHGVMGRNSPLTTPDIHSANRTSAF